MRTRPYCALAATAYLALNNLDLRTTATPPTARPQHGGSTEEGGYYLYRPYSHDSRFNPTAHGTTLRRLHELVAAGARCANLPTHPWAADGTPAREWLLPPQRGEDACRAAASTMRTRV